MSEFLVFEHIGFSPTGKTQVWNILTKDKSAWLGQIKWYAPWRKYCLVTGDSDSSGIIFDTNCLQEIINFINFQMRHKIK